MKIKIEKIGEDKFQIWVGKTAFIVRRPLTENDKKLLSDNLPSNIIKRLNIQLEGRDDTN